MADNMAALAPSLQAFQPSSGTQQLQAALVNNPMLAGAAYLSQVNDEKAQQAYTGALSEAYARQLQSQGQQQRVDLAMAAMGNIPNATNAGVGSTIDDLLRTVGLNVPGMQSKLGAVDQIIRQGKIANTTNTNANAYRNLMQAGQHSQGLLPADAKEDHSVLDAMATGKDDSQPMYTVTTQGPGASVIQVKQKGALPTIPKGLGEPSQITQQPAPVQPQTNDTVLMQSQALTRQVQKAGGQPVQQIVNPDGSMTMLVNTPHGKMTYNIDATGHVTYK